MIHLIFRMVIISNLLVYIYHFLQMTLNINCILLKILYAALLCFIT